jgi:polysaccharide pyruvyl transferase WcaK-like protein
VSGNYGNGNLGDEATLQGLLQLLRIRLPDAKIVAFAMNPADTTERHGIPAEPATRLAARASAHAPEAQQTAAATSVRPRVKTAVQRVRPLYRVARTTVRLVSATARVVADPLFELHRFQTLRRTDLLVIGGGGQLSEPTDIFSSLPLLVLKMTLLARLAGARVLILNVGVQPRERRTTRMFVRAALGLARYRSVRDEASRALVASIGAATPLDVYPDLAYGLDELATGSHRESTRVVAVNVFPHFDGRYLPAAGNRYQNYLDTLSSLTVRVLERGYRVILFPTQIRADPPAIADLKAHLATLPQWESMRPRVIEPQVATVADLLEVLNSCDLVVATRFHAVVLAFRLGRPVLALAGHSKTADAMNDMGQGAFFFDADEVDPDALAVAFEQLEAVQRAVSVELRQRASAKRALLAEEFDRLFGTEPTKLEEG